MAIELDVSGFLVFQGSRSGKFTSTISFQFFKRLMGMFAFCSIAACSSVGSKLPPLPDFGPHPYILGTGDKLQIHLYGIEGLSGGAAVGGSAQSSSASDASEYTVSDTGKIGVPLIGEVQATGLTVAQLKQDITEKLASSYIKDPKVGVEVMTYRPFFIFGEVNHPGSYPYATNLNVLSAIATAGGYTYRAEEKFAVIERKINGKAVKGKVETSTPVSPDDIIRIPERFF
jgi:polysaccharide export outer membrane protein